MERNRIRDEIVGLLRNFRRDSKTGSISANFTFPANFIGFDGHFPENPILPGICQIQCVLVVLSEEMNTEVRVSEVQRARFLNTVIPGEEILVKGTTESIGDSLAGKFVISKQNGEKKITVSRLKIYFTQENS